MKLLIGLLMVAIIKTVFSNSSSDGYSDASFSISSKNDATIIHHMKFETTLNHLVVDRNTGRVFIGGVNRLYQLSPDLDIQAMAVTGPRNDSTDCTALECTKTDTIQSPIDNYNKVLLIDYSASRLITCGSVFQGICTVRNLQNASIVEQEVQEAVFSEGKENVPTNRSALCVYSLKAIRRKFMQNIKACFNGNIARGLDFISPNTICVASVKRNGLFVCSDRF